MIRYIDLIAYPIMLLVVYVLIGLVSWEHDPGNWTIDFRFIWIIWGLVWGFALQRRIVKGGLAW